MTMFIQTFEMPSAKSAASKLIKYFLTQGIAKISIRKDQNKSERDSL